MNTTEDAIRDIESFIKEWQLSDTSMCNSFEQLFRAAVDIEGVSVTFEQRPGVSYSIRPRYQQQHARKMFAMIDVIDDDPENRWLSVCFYGDMITDPSGKGEVIPGGLAGDDGYCFDITEADGQYLAYVHERLLEAARAAATHSS